jgi:hypothetical protein
MVSRRAVGVSMSKNKIKMIASVITIAGLLLTLAGLYFTKFIGITSGGTMVEVSYDQTYSIMNLLVATIGSFVMGVGLMLALFMVNREPVAGSKTLPTIGNMDTPTGLQRSIEENGTRPQVGPAVHATSGPVNNWMLVIRLLTGDERTIFRAIAESGGEIWQNDLITRTKMSTANVSKALEKLVEKGVASMTRHGMMNKVRLNIQP